MNNNPDLTQKLLEMQERDQTMRRSGVWDDTVDPENTVALKEIVDTIGWPTISKVGENAATAAWLIALHADQNIPLQERWLNIMRQESPAEVSPSHVAYLTDRVRVNRGREQVYGTQFYTDKNGVYGPYMIEDVSNLDERRRKVGLGPFAEYKQKMIEKHENRIA